MELLRLYAEAYCKLQLQLGMISIVSSVPGSADEIPASETIQPLITCLTEIEGQCRSIGLEATEDAISGALQGWENYRDERILAFTCVEISKTLQRELARRVCFILPKASQELYEFPTRGWEKILNAFPDCQEDVEEMNRCLAFDRYPAAVFHVLLVVELGVIKLGEFIGVQDRKPGWDATCRELDAIMKKGRNTESAPIKEHFQFLELVNADIQSMKMAWRNKVNHVAGKLVVLTSDFKPQVANKIISACHGFMLLLSTQGPLKL